MVEKQHVQQKTDYTLCSTQPLVAQVSVAALAAHFVVVVVPAAGTHILCAVLQDENDKMFKTQTDVHMKPKAERNTDTKEENKKHKQK